MAASDEAGAHLAAATPVSAIPSGAKPGGIGPAAHTAAVDPADYMTKPSRPFVESDQPGPDQHIGTDATLQRAAVTGSQVEQLSLPGEENPELARAQPKQIAKGLTEQFYRHFLHKNAGWDIHIDADPAIVAGAVNGHDVKTLQDAAKMVSGQQRGRGNRELYEQIAYSLDGDAREDFLQKMRMGFDPSVAAAQVEASLHPHQIRLPIFGSISLPWVLPWVSRARFGTVFANLNLAQREAVSEQYEAKHGASAGGWKLLADIKNRGFDWLSSLGEGRRRLDSAFHVESAPNEGQMLAAVTGRDQYAIAELLVNAVGNKDRKTVMDVVVTQPREFMARVVRAYDELTASHHSNFEDDLAKLFNNAEQEYLKLRTDHGPALDELVAIAARAIQYGEPNDLLATEFARSLRPEQRERFVERLNAATGKTGGLADLIGAGSSAARTTERVNDLMHLGDPGYFYRVFSHRDVRYDRLSTLVEGLTPGQLQKLSVDHFKDTGKDLFFDLKDIAYRDGRQQNQYRQPVEYSLGLAFFGLFGRLAIDIYDHTTNHEEGKLYDEIRETFYVSDDRQRARNYNLTSQAYECIFGSPQQVYGTDAERAKLTDVRDGMLRTQLRSIVPDSANVAVAATKNSESERIKDTFAELVKGKVSDLLFAKTPTPELTLSVIDEMPQVMPHFKSVREQALRHSVLPRMTQ